MPVHRALLYHLVHHGPDCPAVIAGGNGCLVRITRPGGPIPLTSTKQCGGTYKKDWTEMVGGTQ